MATGGGPGGGRHVNSDDYYTRCHEALHLVVREALPCIDNSLRVWHERQRLTMSPCTGICYIYPLVSTASLGRLRTPVYGRHFHMEYGMFSLNYDSQLSELQ